MNRVSTAFLLTCAAIGVAGGVVFVGANWLSTFLFATAPALSPVIAGVWLLPAVVGLRLLQRPLAGLLVGLISGLVIVPFSGYGFGSVATNLWWAFFAELPFLIVLYRFWKTWQHYAGAITVGVVWPILAAQTYDLWAQPLGAQIVFFALTLASCVIGTLLGIVVADALRRAGVARLARRRPTRPAPTA